VRVTVSEIHLPHFRFTLKFSGIKSSKKKKYLYLRTSIYQLCIQFVFVILEKTVLQIAQRVNAILSLKGHILPQQKQI